MPTRLAILATAVAAMMSVPAHAGPLDGLGTCTLTVSTGGIMTMSPTGLMLSSQNTGGLGAAILLVGVNLVPQITFSAPTVTGPVGWSGTPTTMISIDTLSGTRTGFSSGPLVIRPGVLIDTITVHSRVTADSGFRQGSYSVRTTATCQSAS